MELNNLPAGAFTQPKRYSIRGQAPSKWGLSEERKARICWRFELNDANLGSYLFDKPMTQQCNRDQSS